MKKVMSGDKRPLEKFFWTCALLAVIYALARSCQVYPAVLPYCIGYLAFVLFIIWAGIRLHKLNTAQKPEDKRTGNRKYCKKMGFETDICGDILDAMNHIDAQEAFRSHLYDDPQSTPSS